MGHRCKDAVERAGTFQFRALEVVLMKQSALEKSRSRTAVLTVENDWDTLSYVKENMADIAANLVRVKTMKLIDNQHVDESARLFENNLQPLFTLISATSTEHVMDKLSISLRKALLLMAMDRYSCDSEMICRALGITKLKLEKELKRCGLLQQEQQAA